LVYSIDTSALLDAWVRWYPPDIFSNLWENFDSLINEGNLIASEEVYVELEKKEDDLYKWVKERSDIFQPISEDIQNSVSEILAIFPTLVDSRKDRSQADPFVIALARIKDCTVVTGERNTGTSSRPRIPNVCDHFGIRNINIVTLIREQGWRF
jgi:hypothetical protein